MNVEQLEHELNNHKDADVVAVRPGFGTQSESWPGILTVRCTNFPMMFQVQSPRGATIFHASDVASVEDKRLNGIEWQFIVRLKGPMDYLGKANLFTVL